MMEPLSPALIGSVAVSHSYSHILEFAIPIEMGGLRIEPGDLLHGDQHGVLQIPAKVASNVPATAQRILETEQKIIALCQSDSFSLGKLIQLIRDLGPGQNTLAMHRADGERGEHS